MRPSVQRVLRLLAERASALRGVRLRRVVFDDGSGLPPANRATVRLGNGLAWVATALMALVGLWEIDSPFAAGHYAASTAVALGGENMLRWGVLAPVTTYLNEPPVASDFYCHHPFGVFWTAAAFNWLFGHHAWVCRLPAVLLSMAMPRLVYGAGRALYGPLSAGVSALAYVVLPITLAYATFFCLELPTMFGMALATYGYARFLQTERRRFGVLAVLGMAYAAACDWPGFFFDALVLGALFLRTFVLRRFVRPFPVARLATLWAWAVVSVGALAVFHFAALVKLDQVGELLHQGEFRATGSDLPLSTVLEQRRYWIELAFTPLAIVVGKVGAVVLAGRLLIGRRELELFPLAVLATAGAQYVVFKQGADIHFFWPEYFALYFAYALGAVLASLESWLGWATERRSLMPGRKLVAYGVGALGLACVLAIVPDGLRSLVYARQSGGRFNERGGIILPDFDKSAALAAVAPTLPRHAVFGVANSLRQSYWMDWVLRRPVRYVGLPRVGRSGVSYYGLDMRFDTRGAIDSLTREFPVRAYGPILVAAMHRPPQPVEGYALVPRRLGGLARFFTATTHEVYDAVPDPFWTWELRTHLGQNPNPTPHAKPATNEQLRIAHDIALAEGDRPRAARLLDELMTGVDRSVARRYTGGVELLGARLERGDSLRLTLYFTTSAPLPTDAELKITSFVERAPRLSLVAKDQLPWDVGVPFAIPMSLWRPGFVYSSITLITRRPGSERYDATFRGAIAPVPLDGPAATTVLRLE